MSRIHDALKKAEQERLQRFAPGVAVDALESQAAEMSAVRLSPVIEGHQSSLQATATENSGDLGNLQSMLEGCGREAWKPNRKMMLSFDRRSPFLGLEEFRTLRSHLDRIRQQQPLRSLLVTSALSQEGKTLVAANLAQVFARQQGRRTLLIDGDLRLSRMHAQLGAPSAPGLSEYLNGLTSERSIVHRGQLDDLFLIPGGRRVTNPAELIGNGRLGLLLQRLAPVFDWIVLDSPPAIPVSDAKLIAASCDGVLMVVDAGSTPFDLARKACQEFGQKRLLGVVLNRVDRRSLYSSYHRYSGSHSPSENGGILSLNKP